MQSKETQQLRKDKKGEPCKHPNIEKEYYLGGQTGDYACRTCGDSQTRSGYYDLGTKKRVELKFFLKRSKNNELRIKYS